MISSLPAVPGMANASPELKRALAAVDCVEPGLAAPLCAVISLFTDGTFDPEHGVNEWHPVTSPAMGLLRWYEGTASVAGVPKGHVPRHSHWLRLYPYTGSCIWSIALMPGPRQLTFALRLFERMHALGFREADKLALVALGAMPTLDGSWVLGKVNQEAPHLPPDWDLDGDGQITIRDLKGRLAAVSDYARALPQVPIPDEPVHPLTQPFPFTRAHA